MTVIVLTEPFCTLIVASSPVPIPVTELAPIPVCENAEPVVGVSPIPVFPSNVKPDVLSVTEEPIDTIRPVFVPCVNSLPLVNVALIEGSIEILCVLEYAITGFFFLILPKSNLLL